MYFKKKSLYYGFCKNFAVVEYKIPFSWQNIILIQGTSSKLVKSFQA